MKHAVNGNCRLHQILNRPCFPDLTIVMHVRHVPKLLKNNSSGPAADYNRAIDRNLSFVKDSDLMPKPTDEELEKAIRTAISMRENSDDPDMLAKCLLSHNYRIRHLEDVLTSADRYFNMGMSERERAHLIRAIEKAKNAESYTSQTEQERFGLE